MIDFGSPISLIRSNFVFIRVCTPATENQSFYRIDVIKLKTLGIVGKIVKLVALH